MTDARETMGATSDRIGQADDDEPVYEITVWACGLDREALDALFERVAEAAHALDEQVSCVGGRIGEAHE